MTRLTTIEIRKDYLHFSAAHFTIFNAEQRERLHGHNWRIAALITSPIGDGGLCFDYAVYKKILVDLCAKYDEYTLIPEFSPYLTIGEDDDFFYVTHAATTMHLLKSDTLLLPVRNITIEELADYLLQQLLEDKETLKNLDIQALRMEVSSGTDQWASSEWSCQ